MNKKALIIPVAVAAGMVTPQLASAHPATIACNPNGGLPVVTAPPWVKDGHTTYVTDIMLQTDGSFKVSWADGYVRILQPPANCGPVQPPTPTPPEVTPPPASPPPAKPPTPPTCDELKVMYPLAGKARLIAWGCATPNPPKPHTTIKRRTTRIISCDAGVRRAYRFDLITTTTRIGSKITSINTRLVRVNGPVCRVPAVTG